MGKTGLRLDLKKQIFRNASSSASFILFYSHLNETRGHEVVPRIIGDGVVINSGDSEVSNCEYSQQPITINSNLFQFQILRSHLFRLASRIGSTYGTNVLALQLPRSNSN